MRMEIENLRSHLEAATSAGSMLQQEFLRGQISNSLSAMAQLETDTRGRQNMAELFSEKRSRSSVTAFGFAGDPIDIASQLHLKVLSEDTTISQSMVVLLRPGASWPFNPIANHTPTHTSCTSHAATPHTVDPRPA